MRAWVTLLTNAEYLPGVRVLAASLARVGSAYPLVVMVTPSIEAADRQVLRDEGCEVREVEPLRPPPGLADSYANARFAEVWTKLEVWRLQGLERVVCLDADMLAVRNMDELFDLELDDDQVAACHACRCNPNRITSYPADWTPQTCHYTWCDGLDDIDRRRAEPGEYLNGGILVLRPDEATYERLLSALGAVEDLTRYPFAEQDFLNEQYRGRWRPLPYVYNALKTLPTQHPGLWDGAAVKNLHFIIDKPWQRPLDPTSRYADLERLWWEVATPVLSPTTADAAAGTGRPAPAGRS